MTESNPWKLILEELRPRTNPLTFSTWLGPTRFVRVSGEHRLVVQVPNDEFRDYLTEHFAGVVAEACRKLALDLTIEYELITGDCSTASGVAPASGRHAAAAGTALPSTDKGSPARSKGGSLPTSPGVSELPGVVLANVHPQPVDWLWPGRLAHGKPTLLDGDTGVGKSLITVDISARLTSGRPMPAETTQVAAASVVIVSAEESAQDTIRPRVDAAGGDAARVRVIHTLLHEKHGESLFTIPYDLSRLESAIEHDGARLVIFDPLIAFFPQGSDSNNDHAVRRILFPLSLLAEKTRVAILMVRHLSKKSYANPVHGGGGSIGIIASARIALLAGRLEDRRHILAGLKINIDQMPKSLAYHVEKDGYGRARVVWDGVTLETAYEVSRMALEDREKQSSLEEAEAFLRDLLSHGPKLTTDIFNAAREQRISVITLRRAKARLRIDSFKSEFTGGAWLWRLPGTSKTLTLPFQEPGKGD